MSENKSNKRPLWIALLVLLLIVLAGVFLMLSNKSETPPTVPPVETPEETETPAQSVPTVPSEQTETPTQTVPETPSDPVEIVEAQTVTIPGLEIGMDSIEAEDVIEAFLKLETTEGNQTYNMRITPQTANGYSLVAAVDNMADDSLMAQDITAIFRPGEVSGTFILSVYTSRVKCRRNASSGWQTTSCP